MYAFNEKVTYEPGGLTPPGVPAIVANPALGLVADDARVGRYAGGRFGYAERPAGRCAGLRQEHHRIQLLPGQHDHA